MRRLFLLRGLPASGKSTFIRGNGLEKLTLCADDIRLMYGSYSYNLDPEKSYTSSPTIKGNQDGRVWKLLFSLLEERMLKGETIFVDATHYSRRSLNEYNKLKEKYKYKVYVVDFTHVPLDVCLARNAERGYKRVPSDVIRKMHTEMIGTSIPSRYNLIKPDDLKDIANWKVTDLNKYKQVQIIGDIHSCYTALMEGLELENGSLRDDTFYVFTGDYFDRGIEHVETFKFITSIQDKENVVLLEGNHEIHWRNLLTGHEVRNFDTKKNTFPPILAYLDDIYKHSSPEEKLAKRNKVIARFVRSLMPVFYFHFNGEYYLCNHGGITRDYNVSSIGFYNSDRNYMENFDVPEEIYVKGIGGYQYDIDEAWDHNNQLMSTKVIQVHGHRNIGLEPIDKYKSSWNLEQGVETGLNLGTVVISKDHTEFRYTPNPVFNHRELERNLQIDLNTLDNDTIRDILDDSPFIHSKIFYEPRSNSVSNFIKSYNFTREAFRGQKWNRFSIMARGLFLNENGDIVMRGYHKFFNLEENNDNKLENVLRKVTYPITAREKHDGFLGLSSFYQYEGRPLFSSKGGSHSHGKVLEHSISKEVDINNYIKVLKKYKDVTFLFECISEEGDMPHIVDYHGDALFLLDAINNDYTGTFNMDAFKEMASLGFNVPKERSLPDEESLLRYIEETRQQEDTEGAVLRDSNGYMFKLKTEWYSLWKSIRRHAPKLSSLDKTEVLEYISKIQDNRVATTLLQLNEKGILRNDLNTGSKEVDYNVKMIRERFQKSAD